MSQAQITALAWMILAFLVVIGVMLHSAFRPECTPGHVARWHGAINGWTCVAGYKP